MMGRIAGVCLLLAACAADKGVEDDPLVDGKADSFYNPTSHGQLVFGLANEAKITSDEKFHSWVFTLTDSATISLRTKVSTNLDTVMYLYRRDAGSSASFGSYIEKNDDHEDEIYSQIDFEGEPGEYRVIVKAFKTAQLGEFSVIADCDGAGCPGPGSCVADQFGTLPTAATKVSMGCATGLLDALSARAGSTNTVSVAESEVCTLDGAAKLSVDLYRAYWDDTAGWDAFKDGEDDIELEVATTTRGSSTEVFVDAPFDEDAMVLTYGADGQLLALYQDNQSPDARPFCDESGTINAPSDFCIGLMRDSLRHSVAETAGTATTSCDDASNGQLPVLVDAPICEFTSKHSIADSTSVSVTYRSWRAESGLLGAEVKLSASGKTETYYVGTAWNDTTKILATKTASAVTFPCLEL